MFTNLISFQKCFKLRRHFLEPPSFWHDTQPKSLALPWSCRIKRTVPPKSSSFLEQLFPFKKGMHWSTMRLVHCFIKTNYSAGFPITCDQGEGKPDRRLGSPELFAPSAMRNPGLRILWTLTFVVVWIVRMRQRASWTIKCIRVTVIQSDKSN